MITEIPVAQASQRGISLQLWQDDFKPAIAAGNKRFKLAGVFQEAKKQGATRVLTFGGAWSNHIHAIAFLAGQFGLGSIGIIRAEKNSTLTATLDDARRYGMELQFVSREQYRQRHSKSYLQQLQYIYPDALIVPEGGSSEPAVAACGAILNELEPEFVASLHTVACAVGTGATLCGVRRRLGADQAARGYTVVKDPSREQAMQRWINGAAASIPTLVPVNKPVYGQVDAVLLRFIDEFYLSNGILLDPLYTAKMMQHLMHEIEQGVFPVRAAILALHTGGLQGWRGFLTPGYLTLLQTSLSEPTLKAINALLSHY